MTQLPPPGWYPDPAEPEHQRYWDGAGWSDDGYAEAMAAAEAQRASAAAKRAAAQSGVDLDERPGGGQPDRTQTAPQQDWAQAPAPTQQPSPDNPNPPGQPTDELFRPPQPNRPYGAPAQPGPTTTLPGPPDQTAGFPQGRPGDAYGRPPQGYPHAPYPGPRGLQLQLGGQTVRVADWWQRALAKLLDLIIVVAVAMAVTLPFFSSYLHALSSYFSEAESSGKVPGNQPQMTNTQSLVLAAVIWVGLAVYCAVQHRLWGRTIGKRALGIRVLSTDGTPVSWGQAAIRALLADAVVLVPAVGYLWALADNGLLPFVDKTRRQAIHDKAAGTIVVRR